MKALFVLFGLVLLASSAFAPLNADSPSISQCPSSDALDEDKEDCEDDGKDWEYYTDGKNCKQVKCEDIADKQVSIDKETDACPSDEEIAEQERKCTQNGDGSVRIQYQVEDEFGKSTTCAKVECVSASQCLSEEELLQKEKNCFSGRGVPVRVRVELFGDSGGITVIGNTVNDFRDGTCEDVQCVPRGCPSVEEEVKKCESQGDQYKVRWGVAWYDGLQCPSVICERDAEAVECPTEEEIEEKENECTDSGFAFDHHSYGVIAPNGDTLQCKDVECVVSQCPSEEELGEAEKKCEAAGFSTMRKLESYSEFAGTSPAQSNESQNIGSFFDVFTADDFSRQCNYVVCEQPLICKSDEKLLAEIEACKLNGSDYELSKDENGCAVVKCGGSICPTKEEIEAEKKKCEAGTESVYLPAMHTTHYDSFFDVWGELDLEKRPGFAYDPIVYQDFHGCERVLCRPEKACPNSTVLEATIQRCNNAGLNITTYVDQFNCKQVYCGKEPRGIGCEKKVDGNGCIDIQCSDGYAFNSCDYRFQCRVDCKAYTDENGCSVKKCSDGYEARDCPSGEVTCETYKTENGCEVKKCSDGTSYEYCPDDQGCEIYKDEESGCTIKECPDGYKARECPDEPRDDVECKVYEKDGCRVKECTNGYSYDSCKAPKCETSKDEKGCAVKKCDDGYTARDCPEGSEDVECKETKDDEGCVLKVCTDGTEAKYCPEDVGPPPQRGILESIWCAIAGCK